MSKSVAFTALSVLLAACSATAGIEDLGGGQYFVTGHGAFGSYDIANQRAEARARDFCQSQGRTLQVVDWSHDEDPLGVFARLTFECS